MTESMKWIGGMKMTTMEIYRQWLTDFADDKQTVAELEAIAGDE